MKVRLITRCVAPLFVAWVATVAAHAASFDCAKAHTRVEKLICESPELSKLDEEMAVVYAKAIKNKSTVASIRKSQKTWLSYRDESSSTEDFIKIYQGRIAYLTKEVSKAVRSTLAFTLIEDDITTDPYAFCQTMVDNLNSMPSWPPAYCERPLNPVFMNLQLLEWREWTAEEFDNRWYLLQQAVNEEYKTTPTSNEYRWTDISTRRWREDILNKNRKVLEAILPEKTLAFGAPLKRLLRMGAESLEQVQRTSAALGYKPIPAHELPESACNLGHIIPLTEDGSSINTNIATQIPLGTPRWQLWLYEYSPGRYRLEEQHWTDIQPDFRQGVLTHRVDSCRILYKKPKHIQGVN